MSPLNLAARLNKGWQEDGYPHTRNMHGTCINCGASRFEYHYKLVPRDAPNVTINHKPKESV